ncbi:hypothetical protein BH09ACT8_BH09ACT8_11060 [soil metagenome]
MANTTDADSAPVDDEEFGSGAARPGRDFDRPGALPFGDPNQHLYGGGWHSSPAPTAAAASTELPYEGRHRAAD